MTDGIDFEEWNATVRALASAVDRLAKTANELAAPPWAEPLLAALEELKLHFSRFEDAHLWLPRNAAIEPADEEDQEATMVSPLDSSPNEGPDGAALEVANHRESEANTIPIRFGDPAAIARYGRHRRR